jgi:hypothetical protein
MDIQIHGLHRRLPQRQFEEMLARSLRLWESASSNTLLVVASSLHHFVHIINGSLVLSKTGRMSSRLSLWMRRFVMMAKQELYKGEKSHRAE